MNPTPVNPIPSTQSVESNDEPIKINVYDEHGYLPIHRAALHGYEAVIKAILDDALRRNDIAQQLEAKTRDANEFTPFLLAVAVGRLETIPYLLKYPVNLHAVDSNGHTLAAVAVLSQNERTLRYLLDLPLPPAEYNMWQFIFKLFLSIKEEECVTCGRMLELLTRHDTNALQSNAYWLPMIDNGLLPTLIQVFSFAKHDDVLLSAYLLLLNLVSELPERKSDFKNIKNTFSAMLKHTRSSNTQLLTLLGRVLSSLSEEPSLIDSMAEQGLIDCLVVLLDKQRLPSITCSYFDCLSNVVSHSFEYQHAVANCRDFLQLIVNVYLEEFDLALSLALIRFIRQLAKHNESIQILLAHYGVCDHILGALSASSKELQQVAIEAIQSMADNNAHVQQILLRERAIEQLLSLLEKTNMSNLQVALVCTLWTLCETSAVRRHDVSLRIGVRKLVSFYTIKSQEHLFAVTDALNELAKCTASVTLNVQEEINRAQGIPYLIRLLKSDNQRLVLSVLKTLQLTTCASGFVPNRANQDVVIKTDGLPLIVALVMHAKDELIQVEAAQCLACVALSHMQCSILVEHTLDFSYAHIIYLMQSKTATVQLKAGNALATFVYNNSRVQLNLSQHYRFSFDYFEKFLQADDDSVRCATAFQLVVLAGLIPEQRQSITTAIGCGILIDLLRKSPVDDAKSAAAECLARLAHMKSVSEVNKHTGIPQALIAADVIEYLCDLYCSSSDTTIGNASMALGFLSYIPEGRRKLLNRCRSEPDIMNFLKVFNCVPGMSSRLSKTLVEEWDRYHALKLPKLRSQRSTIRYFKVLSNNMERSRIAPSSTHENEPAPSHMMKYYVPTIRQRT